MREYTRSLSLVGVLKYGFGWVRSMRPPVRRFSRNDDCTPHEHSCLEKYRIRVVNYSSPVGSMPLFQQKPVYTRLLQRKSLCGATGVTS